MKAKLEKKSLLSLSSASKTGAVGVMLIGLLALVNWLVNDRIFSLSDKNALALMNPVTAITFILASFNIFLLQSKGKQASPWSKRRFLLSISIVVPAAMKILTFLTGHDLDLDTLVFIYNSNSSSMAPNTAITSLLVGLSLLMIDVRPSNGIRPSVILNLGALMICFLALVGHGYQVMSLYQIRDQVPMTTSIASTFIFLCVSILFTQPETEPVATIFSNTTGGLIGRRLLPAATLVPFVLGWLVFWADRNLYLPIDSGMTIFVLSNSIFFITLVWWNARHLYRLDTETKYLMDLLSKKAMIDGLTGLWNRHHFDQRLETELGLLKRNARTFTCIIGDVDHFKAVNDTYGHETGDEVLRKVAGALMGRCRGMDVACRFGGEEFVIILPNTTALGAALVAERIRRAVEKLSFQYESKEFKVTCSFGVAQAYVGQESVIKDADAALYKAKHGGRNQVVISDASVAGAEAEATSGNSKAS